MAAIALDDSVDPRIASSVERSAWDIFEADKRVVEEK
jgi:hypothetical protein